jgi:hypothetical protein
MKWNVIRMSRQTSCELRMTLNKIIQRGDSKDTGKLSVADWQRCDADLDPTISILKQSRLGFLYVTDPSHNTRPS